MANNQLPYTLQDIQNRIYTLTDSDIATPSPTDDEWNIRLNLIHLAIGEWERQDVLWNELWAPTTVGACTAPTTVYPITSDGFRFPGSLLRVVKNGATSYVDIVKPEEMTMYRNNGNVAYFTGNQSVGYKLNLGWTPVANDWSDQAALNFDYYRSAYRPVATTDIPEMSDPDFIVYWVAAQKLFFNGRSNLAQLYEVKAQSCLDNMRVMNELKPHYSKMVVDDADAIRDNDSFGL